MTSSFGETLRLSLFGESHGPAVGCVIDAPPPGLPLDLDAVRRHLSRRRPGQAGACSTPRRETDEPEILSGFFEGRTTGTPLAAVIRNSDTRSGDYAALLRAPRPGHGDLTGRIRYGGFNDPRGGGHFSARVTAGLCFAGAVALQALAARGVKVRARVLSVGGAADPTPVDPCGIFADVSAKPFPALSDDAAAAMVAEIESARAAADSVGGVVEVRAEGMPPGVGAPFFDRVETHLGGMLFSLPAVRGVEFGDGFECARRRGSSNNDAPVPAPGAAPDAQSRTGFAAGIRRATNRAGGAEGGITTGMPVVARVAFKPTPSIASEQTTVDPATNEPKTLRVPGRHDPCVVPRAVPLVESAAAFALWDMLLGAAAKA